MITGRKTLIVISIIGVICALIAIGIYTTLSISSNRFDCASTRKRLCTDEFIRDSILPREYIEKLFNLICSVNDAFADAKMLYCVIGGTLLSAMRGNHALIPWDDDADIAVFSVQWQNEKLRNALDSALQKRGLCLERAQGFLTDRIRHIDSVGKKNEPFMDVFVYTVDPANPSELHYADPICRARFPRERMQLCKMFPLRTTALRCAEKSFDVCTPNKPNEYLEKTYGLDWRTNVVVANHRGISMVAPCTMTDEQAKMYFSTDYYS